MVATSVGITARVLGDLHVLATRHGQNHHGRAVFDDILGMVLAYTKHCRADRSARWITHRTLARRTHDIRTFKPGPPGPGWRVKLRSPNGYEKGDDRNCVRRRRAAQR